MKIAFEDFYSNHANGQTQTKQTDIGNNITSLAELMKFVSLCSVHEISVHIILHYVF